MLGGPLLTKPFKLTGSNVRNIIISLICECKYEKESAVTINIIQTKRVLTINKVVVVYKVETNLLSAFAKRHALFTNVTINNNIKQIEHTSLTLIFNYF